MSVVLLILKIIGIVLAAVLGIFLLLLLAALFHPVGYLVTGQFEEELHLRVKLHWLLHLVRLTHRIDGEEQFARLWILCVPLRLYPASEKKPRRKRTGRKKNRQSATDTTEITEHHNTEKKAPETTPVTGSSDTEYEEAQKTHTFPLLQKILAFCKKLPKQLRKIGGHVGDLREIVTDEANQASMKLLLREGKTLLLHYRPRKLTADIVYGLGDPALTGQSLAVLSMIPFLYREKVQIVPDFETEQAFLKGTFAAVGHLRLIHLIRSGIHIWKDENCRTIMSKWKD